MGVELKFAIIALSGSASVVLGVFIFQAIVYWKDRRDWRVEKAELMNRLMSRTFGEFATGQHKMKAVPDEPVTAKERMSKDMMEYERLNDTIPVN